MSIFNELELIEEPAIEIFKVLGYEHLNCYNETFGPGGTLGRDNTGEVVLIQRLQAALSKLNPDVPNEAITLAIEELTKDRSILNPANANREIYRLIHNGVKVSIRNEDGSEDVETVKVIDFQNPENNDFFLASQFWVTGEMYKRRADLVGFVNGLPLIFIELKALDRKLENAYNDNLTDYKDTIPQIFWYNAIILLSNGAESRIGSFTASYEHFSEWKKIDSEGEEGVVSLDTIIKGTCEKARFIDLLENFILYQDASGTVSKIIARNHQFLGVNNAIESFRRIKENQGRLGVFWHTQGSGKSFSMIFFSQKVLRKFEGNYTFLIVTDRKELDEQIYRNFAEAGAVTEDEVHAESGMHLRQLLSENHRNIFTLIHKFGDIRDVVSERSDIIVITDEAHRSQYDTLAMNMRTALPNAAFIAFTGTPLMAGEEKTKNTFGDYISVYNFKQSIDDNATVPLYYENRIPEVQLDETELKEGFEQILEDAMLSPEEEEKLQREFSREYHIITRDDRLEKIAEDIVKHFINRGYQGKAMVVSIDKPTAVKMYDKVQNYWKKHINDLKAVYADEPRDRTEHIAEKIRYMEETDMAVVVSQEQNEVQKFRKLGLDIEGHRRRMGKEDLATKFKEPGNPLRIVFVCAMWMTGFDVPCLSTMYLDKPMKNHTLMQTIARANRVFQNKTNGLLVDYCGIFRSLQKALAIYGPGPDGKGGDNPVKPKRELIRELEEAIGVTETLCIENGVDIRKIIDADRLNQIQLISDAADAFLVNDDLKGRFLALASQVNKLYKAILPDPDAKKYTDISSVIKIIAERIRSVTGGDVDIDTVKEMMVTLLDNTVTVAGIKDDNVEFGKDLIDLSKIDFDRLRKRFVKGRKNTQVAALEAVIRKKLDKLVKLNKTRIELLEKFLKMIAEYNSGSMNIEKLFEELLSFIDELNEEESRGIRENLNEEELALFDLIKKPKLTKKELNQVKSASKSLLRTLKTEKLVLDWRKRQQTRAEVLFTIQTLLDEMLPESYDKDIYSEKCTAAYQHIYDSYYGDGKSIYASAT
jgi:type I restriction enzyme R subunit